jgi:hypothetical protein
MNVEKYTISRAAFVRREFSFNDFNNLDFPERQPRRYTKAASSVCNSGGALDAPKALAIHAEATG